MNLTQPKIFASKTHLKRYWPSQNRKEAYKSALQNLTTNLKGKNVSVNDYCFVIVERFVNGQWADQIYYVPKAHTLQSLYKRIVGNSNNAYFFYTPKTHQMVMISAKFEELFQKFKNPDDNFIYLGIDEMNAFGADKKENGK